ncbi:MAG: ABC transporter ATP-binding protein [Planctomycetota bacterium]
MDSFWRFAKELTHDRALVACALLLALLASAGLGAGIASVAPVLSAMLDGPDQARGLQEMVVEANVYLRDNVWLEPQVPQAVIDVLPTRPWRSVVVIMVGIGLLTILSALATFGHQFLSLTAVYRASQRIRDRAFEHVIRLPLRTVVTGDSSDISRRVVDETERLAEGFAAILSKGATQVGKGLAALAVAIIFEPLVTLVSLVTAPVLFVVIRALGQRVRRARKRAFAGQAQLLARAGNVLRGLRVVKVQTAEPAEIELFRETNRDVIREMLKARTARALSSPVSEVVAITAVGVLAAVAVKAVLDSELDPKNFMLALMALGIAAASLRPLTGIINEIQAAAAASERIEEIMDLEPEPGTTQRLPDLPRHRASVSLEGITFTYPGSERPALRGVSIQVTHGERIAFVGPNGSGKTTLLSLIPRLFDPEAGRVLIDGLDITEHSTTSLRSQIGAVTQETVIFPGTIRSNMSYGTAGVTDEQILDAAARAHAMPFIEQLAEGIETPVGEQGLTLSGGQRQRLAIARAILRDPAILIMDEATSMIDADSEAHITEAINDFSRGRTTLVVAHRLSTVVSSDRIAVLDQGELIDIGTHADLLDRCEVYRTLARTQLVGSGPRESSIHGKA